jgi:uncharacterized protein YqgC (DUF456 family)
MSRRAKPLLAASLGALIGAVVALGIVAGRRERALVDDGAERDAVLAAAHQILPASAEGAADPRLRQAVERLAAAPGVARLWLVDGDGRIALGFRGPGRPGEAVAELAPPDDRATIDSLRPPLPAADRLALLAAAAIRRDGDHNDVFKPLTLPVPDADGRTRAVVALCYDIGSKAGMTAMTVLPVVTGLLLYWLGLAAWVFFDARARRENPWLWGLLVLVTNLAGALAYVIATRREATGPSPGGPHTDLLAGLAILLLLLGPLVGAEAMVAGAVVALALGALLVLRSRRRGQTGASS